MADLSRLRMRYSVCLREHLTTWGALSNSMGSENRPTRCSWWSKHTRRSATEHLILRTALLDTSRATLLSLCLTSPLLLCLWLLWVIIYSHHLNFIGLIMWLFVFYLHQLNLCWWCCDRTKLLRFLCIGESLLMGMLHLLMMLICSRVLVESHLLLSHKVSSRGSIVILLVFEHLWE